jgi:Domain of unknown function (DUF5667)
VDSEFDEFVDPSIAATLEGDTDREDGANGGDLSGYRMIAAEISRVLSEESPRLKRGTQAQHLARMRAEASSRRTKSRLILSWLSHSARRWAQVAAIAFVVVVMANGITVASATSLPGSPLYPVKRLAEQSNVFLSPTPGKRAQLWMTLASRRLDEVQRLLAIQPRVEPRVLDDVDESILHALTEIAATRGPERIGLLEQIIQLSLREQTVLDSLAKSANTDDRLRFQQSARLLEDVAHIAGSAQSNLELPAQTVTGTASASPSPTATETKTPDLSRPTDVPTSSILGPTTTAPLVLPGQTETPEASSGDGGEGTPAQSDNGGSAQTPKPQKNANSGGKGSTPVPKPSTPQPQQTSSGGGDGETTPAPSDTGTPTGRKWRPPWPGGGDGSKDRLPSAPLS